MSNGVCLRVATITYTRLPDAAITIATLDGVPDPTGC